MYRYEVRLARGKTAEELGDSMNELANVRIKEVEEALSRGYDVVLREHEHFKPSGQVLFIGGEWVQPMKRLVIVGKV